jgi:hypothetical protein
MDRRWCLPLNPLHHSSAARKRKISTAKDDSVDKDKPKKKKPHTSSHPAKKTEDDKAFKMPKGVILSNGEALDMDVDDDDALALTGKKQRQMTGMTKEPY